MCAREAGQLEVADIFREYGPLYRNAHPMPANRLHAMRAIETCRTADQGGHVDECGHCGTKLISYNSCRNRHCPKCQFLKKERWIEDRAKDLLPIMYFHVVFTVDAAGRNSTNGGSCSPAPRSNPKERRKRGRRRCSDSPASTSAGVRPAVNAPCARSRSSSPRAAKDHRGYDYRTLQQ